MFRIDVLSDTVINNMCESFNSRILKFKEKPIISMFEDIRLYLMSRFQQNRNSIMRVEFELCLKICKRLHREKMGNGRWLACWASDTKFEVKNELRSFIADLAKGCAVVGNGISLISHAAMQFHAYFSTESKLRNTLMPATIPAHTKHVMSTPLIHSMVPIVDFNWSPSCAASHKEKATRQA